MGWKNPAGTFEPDRYGSNDFPYYYMTWDMLNKLPPAIQWMQRRVHTWWDEEYQHLDVRWDEVESGEHIVNLNLKHNPDTDLPCAWVTPKGRWISVPYAGHNDMLEGLLGGSGSYSAAEQRGWIHVGGSSERDCPRLDGKRITKRQAEVLWKHGYTPEMADGGDWLAADENYSIAAQ